MRCKNCDREWATDFDPLGSHLKYCPGCSGFWELSIEEENYAISGEETLGRFSPLLLLRGLYYFMSGCLLVTGTIFGIIIVLIGAGLSWLSDLIFKGRR
jgi:hypothetical protein